MSAVPLGNKIIDQRTFLLIELLQLMNEEGMTELKYHYFGRSPSRMVK